MEAGQNGGGDAASQLAGIQQALVTAGFSSAEDLISAHQKECADHKAAAEARDKFSEHNAKAQVIIRTKGGDIGQLKQGRQQSAEPLQPTPRHPCRHWH